MEIRFDFSKKDGEIKQGCPRFGTRFKISRSTMRRNRDDKKPMNITIERLPECRARLSAEAPANVVNRIRGMLVKAYSQQAKVPGFRKGKLPDQVTIKKFGPQIEEDLRERLIEAVFQDAHKNHNLTIIGIEKIDRMFFESDGAFSLVAEVVSKPEVELKKEDYMNIPVTLLHLELTEEMVDSALERIQRNMSEFDKIQEGAQRGDVVSITFEGYLDGTKLTDILDEESRILAELEEPWEVEIPFSENSSGDHLIPYLPDRLAGIKPEESRTVEIEFGDHFLEELRDQTAVYEVECFEVFRRKMPELDDELAGKFGLESLDDLRDNIREDLSNQQQAAKEEQIRNQIFSHLNSEHEFEVPSAVVFDQAQRRVNSIYADALERGIDPDEIEEREEEIVDSAQAYAITDVRTRYILSKIADLEGLEISDKELTQRLEMQAFIDRKPFKKVVREIRDGPGLDSFRFEMLLSKTIAFLVEHASVNEVDLDHENDPDEESAPDEEE